jgi:hypothetical protein
MPRTYEQHGIRFLYPDNWEVSDEQSLEPPYSVGLQTPRAACGCCRSTSRANRWNWPAKR